MSQVNIWKVILQGLPQYLQPEARIGLILDWLLPFISQLALEQSFKDNKQGFSKSYIQCKMNKKWIYQLFKS